MNTLKKVRTRFAPSPTGYLHVGGLRTALFNFLIAKQSGGEFILRIEDTDRQRFVPDAEKQIIELLHAFGLDFDEGPGKDGGHGPYVQSERLEIYHRYAAELLEKRSAYYCFCSSERLAEVRKNQEAQKQPPRYDGYCRELDLSVVQKKLEEKQPHVIRQKVPRTGVTEYEDLVHGRVQFQNQLLEDSILVKSDGYPVYNFANVVDDHLMEISHVVRGEEFLSSTPKHILLYQAYGWDAPKFVHLPLLLDHNRKKLSKRMGDVAVMEYVSKGYLKEAVLNFVAFLGWSPKTTQEIFSLDELLACFAIEKLNKSGAIFDTAKLDHINREWQKRLFAVDSAKIGEFAKVETVSPAYANDPLFIRAEEVEKQKFGQAYDRRLFLLVWPQVFERIKGPSEILERLPEFDFYFQRPRPDARMLVWKNSSPAETRIALESVKKFLETLKMKDLNRQNLEDSVKELLLRRGIKTGTALWPLRVAVSGQRNSPGPFEIIEVFGVFSGELKEITERISTAIEALA